MSTHFKNGKNYNNVGAIYAGVGCNLIPSLSGDDFCATTADFKAWLAAQHAAGTPVTVLYQLAEPTIEQIDPMALPTYPRYTRLECDTQTRAKVRVVETGC